MNFLNYPGSSTTCILSLDYNRSKLKAANLGECGYLVVREKKLFSKSQQKIYGFDFPYRLSHNNIIPFGFIDQTRQVYSVR